MPVKYIPYLPQTVDGQAILTNFQRTRRVLDYRDADQTTRRIDRGMPLYEVETTEHVSPLPSGEGPGVGSLGSLVIRGECVSACAYLKEQNISIDLVYIDPPFASGADYAKQVYLRRNPHVADAIARTEEQLEMAELRSFDEKMYGDIWNKEDYLNWMYENLMAIKTVMSPTASIYLHIDWHIGPYCKVLMDEIFGEANFQAEVVWKRTTAHSDAETYGVTHDTIYFFTKNTDFVFNTVYQPYTEEYLARFRRFDELPDGSKRYWDDGNLTAKGLRGGGYDYTYKGIRSLWRCPPETMEDLDRDGRLLFTSTGGIRSKVYLDELKGMPAQGLWDDIKPVNSQAAERVDYATQKPEALLERIIRASSNEGMVVADFFGGSGVTAAVASKLGRWFIHADVNINSIQTARDRLSATGAVFSVLDVKDGVSLFRNPVQTMDKLRGLIVGLRAEAGLDAFWAGALQDSRAGMVPVYLPNLLDHSTKVLDIPLVNQIVYQAMPALPDGIKRVVIYYVDIADEKAVRAYIADAPTDVTVELRDLKIILDDVVLNDEADYALTEADGQFTLTFSGFRSDRLMQKINDYNLKRGVASTAKMGQLRVDDTGSADTDEPTTTTVTTTSKKKTASFTPIQISDEGLELIEYLSLDCTNATGPWQSDVELKIGKKGFVLLNGQKTGQFWNATIQSERRPLRLKVRNIAGDESMIALQLTVSP